jgi:hypothetical protein
MHACIRIYYLLLTVFTTLVTGLTTGTCNYVDGTTHQGIRHHSPFEVQQDWRPVLATSYVVVVLLVVEPTKSINCPNVRCTTMQPMAPLNWWRL